MNPFLTLIPPQEPPVIPPPQWPSTENQILFNRMLFVYSREGEVKCYSADEIRGRESQLVMAGWKHTATIDPARWIEVLTKCSPKVQNVMIKELL